MAFSKGSFDEPNLFDPIGLFLFIEFAPPSHFEPQIASILVAMATLKSYGIQIQPDFPMNRLTQLLDAWVNLVGEKRWIEQIIESESSLIKTLLLGGR